MIRKFRLYIMLAAVALSATSCLDKMPEDEIPFDESLQTVSDVNLAVIGIYDAFKSSYLYSGNLTLLPDLQTDFVYGVNGNTNIYGDIWRWNDIKPTNTDIEAVYGSLYDVINRCNFLLDRVDNVRNKVTDDSDLDKLDQYCGEAYFARALAYSELVKLFCKAYESDDDAANELGVILTQHYRGDEEMKRASLKDSYQFILDDLGRAAELLKLEDDFDTTTQGALYDSSYFNEYTVYALRARVALYMKKWDEAIEYSTKVIESGYYVLSSCTQEISSGISYYKYMWTNDHSTEVIWKVGFTVNSYGGALGSIFANYDFSTLRPDYVPAEWVINLYDTNDLRVSTIFQSFTTGYSHGLTWPLLIKYFGNEEFLQYNIIHVNMPKVLRLSEQYLIRAEAYAQKEEYGKAGSDISTLRAARYSSYGGSTAMSKDNAMEVIEEERVKELYMEGFRLHDLKRWHKGFEREPQDQSLDNGSSLKVEKDDPLFVWPIPQHELDAPGSEVEPNESNK
ncbi:RagB/SusD family nutrient uptake outer membrane protein [uncultured Bacteroides sp.]|uniref:RagB/SusD family nutrient uptake outer membrane protein n=1 Tax=uncultured Bacteroides sp. TaxID=162156 RepID=UPI00280AB48B|nr:RagB/SusD family nutrient uptake outer membrane protein [uncultured Bacteroides sp.]